MSNNETKKLMNYVIPAVLSQMCMFLFTIIDGIFVGNGAGTTALGAMNIVTPFILVLNAFYMLTSVGGVTITAIRLGRKDQKGANLAFMHALVSIIAIAIIITFCGTVLTKPLCLLLGANETYLPYTMDYIFYYSIFVIPASLSLFFQFFGRNDGAPKLVLYATIISSALNIFLDWLFVFPLEMSLKGAAIATGISQTVSFLIIVSYFIRKRGCLRICRFTPDRKLFSKIFMRGFPETLAQFASPISILCINKVLLTNLGEVSVNAYSVIGYIVSFSTGIFLGVSQGIQPLLGQAYGQHDSKKVKGYFKAGLKINLVCSVIVILAFSLTCSSICQLFGTDSQTLSVAVAAFPKHAIGFIFMSVNIIISSYLYSTKRTVSASAFNTLRSFVITSFVILCIPKFFGIELIWYTPIIYEAISMLIGFILVKYTERKGIIFK